MLLKKCAGTASINGKGQVANPPLEKFL